MRNLRARIERFTFQHPSGVNLAVAVLSAAGAAALFGLIARRVDTYVEVAAAGLAAVRARELWRTDPEKARELGERSKGFLP